MSVRGWNSKEISQPRGAWSLVDQIQKGNPSRAFLAQNVRFSPGKVYSREGTSARTAVAGKTTGMYNWVTSSSNLVLFLEGGTKLRAQNVAGGGPSDLVTGLTARSMAVAESGPRSYVSFFATTGLGSAQCRVTDGASIADKAFQRPIVISSITAADGGAGLCTAGTHKIGFIFQSRSGFTGQPSASTASCTLNAGNRAINLSITLDTPAEAGVGSSIYVLMTRADNPNRWYFVPGAFAILPASSAAWTQGFVALNITDEDLATSAEDASAFFQRLAQDPSGNGPFLPSVVLPYRHRTVYIVDNKAYVSEIDDAQAVTEDQNVIQTPGQKRITAAFAQGQSLYLVGEKAVSTTSDNGDLPATWSQPEETAQIGAPAPKCVEPRTAGGYAWIANEHGLWIFQGTFDPFHPGQPKPITYLCAEWKRINWSAAYAVKVVDDIVNLKCYVAAPLDAATEPTHLFVVDYTNGLTYDTCDISLDNYNAATFSDICVVKETVTARSVLWIGPSAAGSIAVQDQTTHNDQGAAVHPVWESGFVRQVEDEVPSDMLRVGAVHVRVRGNGTLQHTWYGMDRKILTTTNVVVSGGLATVNATGHGLAVRTVVSILGSATAALNGVRVAQSVAANSFTLLVPGVPDGTYTDGLVVAGRAVSGTPLVLSATPAKDYLAKFDLSPVENYFCRIETNAVDAYWELAMLKPYFKPSLYVR
jgi:hypothetical protein